MTVSASDTGVDSSVSYSRLPSLTSLRAFAALLIFFAHALYLLPLYPFLDSGLGRALVGAIPMQFPSSCVTFFFLLSGFVIYWSSGRGKIHLSGYYARRVAKLWPTHLIFFAAVAAITVIPWGSLGTWLPNLFRLFRF